MPILALVSVRATLAFVFSLARLAQGLEIQLPGPLGMTMIVLATALQIDAMVC